MSYYQSTDVIVSGFVRSFMVDDMFIPQEILGLLAQWFDNRYYIKLSGDLLDEFLSKRANRRMGQTHVIQLHDDVIAEFYLIPRRCQEDQLVVFKVDIKALSDDLTDVRYDLYTEFGCLEVPNSLYKEYTSCIHTTEITQSFCLYERCLGLNELTFFINLELLSMKKKGGDTLYIAECPQLDSHIEYQWILKGEELDNFKAAKMKEFVFSPNFGNGCISIYCTPKGYTEPTDVRFGLEFHKLPNDMKHKGVRLELKTNIPTDNGEFYGLKKDCNPSQGDPIGLDKEELTVKAMQSVNDRLVFGVIIDIVERKRESLICDDINWIEDASYSWDLVRDSHSAGRDSS